MKLRTRCLIYFILIGLIPFLSFVGVNICMTFSGCAVFSKNILHPFNWSFLALRLLGTIIIVVLLTILFFKSTVNRIELLNRLMRLTTAGHLPDLSKDSYRDELTELRESIVSMYQRMEQSRAELEENNRKLGYTNMSLEEKYVQSYTIKLIQEEIGRELDTDQLLRKTADVVMGVLGSKRCAIYMQDDIQNGLLIKADSGFGSSTANELIPLDADSIIAKSWRDRETYTEVILADKPEIKAKDLSSRILTIPLNGRQNCLGVMVIEHETAGDIHVDVIEFAKSIAQELSLSVENAFLYGKMRQMAIHDALTGAYNRMYLMTYFAEVFAQHPKNVSVIIMDLDHFKLVNDNYGHLAGDMVLKTTCAVIHRVLPTGILARYGGEEFVIVLPEAPQEEAFKIADNVRQKIAEHQYITNEGVVIPVTLSAGLATYPMVSQSYEKLLNLADQALYEAKNSGRNKVCIAQAQV